MSGLRQIAAEAEQPSAAPSLPPPVTPSAALPKTAAPRFDLGAVLSELDSPLFDVRGKASEVLKLHPEHRMALIAFAGQKTTSAEARARLIDVLSSMLPAYSDRTSERIYSALSIGHETYPELHARLRAALSGMAEPETKARAAESVFEDGESLTKRIRALEGLEQTLSRSGVLLRPVTPAERAAFERLEADPPIDPELFRFSFRRTRGTDAVSNILNLAGAHLTFADQLGIDDRSMALFDRVIRTPWFQQELATPATSSRLPADSPLSPLFRSDRKAEAFERILTAVDTLDRLAREEPEKTLSPAERTLRSSLLACGETDDALLTTLVRGARIQNELQITLYTEPSKSSPIAHALGAAISTRLEKLAIADAEALFALLETAHAVGARQGAFEDRAPAGLGDSLLREFLEKEGRGLPLSEQERTSILTARALPGNPQE